MSSSKWLSITCHEVSFKCSGCETLFIFSEQEWAVTIIIRKALKLQHTRRELVLTAKLWMKSGVMYRTAITNPNTTYLIHFTVQNGVSDDALAVKWLNKKVWAK